MDEKPEFSAQNIDFYFRNKKVYTETGKEQMLDVYALYDDTNNFWIPNSYKYYVVDEITLINKLKEQFNNTASFLNSSIKSRIIEAYKQYGRMNYNQLKTIPKDCVSFRNAIVYVGNKKCPLSAGYSLVDDPQQTNYTESTLDYFVTSPIDYDYDPRKEYSCPTIDKLFIDWVGEKKKTYCMI